MHPTESLPTPVSLPRRFLRSPVAPAVLGTAGFLVAVQAQVFLDRFPDTPYDGLLLYVVAVALWLTALRGAPPRVEDVPMPVAPGPSLDPRRRRALLTGLGLVAFTTLVWPLLAGKAGGGLAVLVYPGGVTDGMGTLTRAGLTLWSCGLVLYLWAVVDPSRIRAAFAWRRPERRTLVTWGRVLAAVAVVTLVAALFRLYDLDNFPREMTSDHTEKLFDVGDILDGWRPVFLPGNAGREPLQFYWTALLVRLGMPYGFWTLKFGMALVSIVTVPIMYWAARHVAGRRIGVAAAVILALAPWHLQVARQSLRIGFAPLFVALALGFVMRALSTGRRNDWLALGAALGIGVYGYTGFRPMVFAVPVIVVLKLALDWWRGRGTGAPIVRRATIAHLAAAAGLAVVLAAPLGRYALDRPEQFWYRTRTRMSGIEIPLATSPARQFGVNLKNGLLMFNRTADSAWFNSPPGRPALETIGGALLVLGVATALARARRGDWRSASLVVLVPFLLLSSVMALAFPIENPSLARAAGALPPVVALAALPVAALAGWWRRAPRGVGSVVLVLLCAAALVAMAGNTAERVFEEYRAGYDNSSHPTREGAAVAHAFRAFGGDTAHVYLVGWPHAWDYRALAIEMGEPEWSNVLTGAEPEFAAAAEEARAHQPDPARKLYFVGGAADVTARNLSVLRNLFPGAIVTRHHGYVAEKEFYSVLVPDTTGAGR